MNKTILIADDDADVVDLLSLRCRALGLEVDSANNAITALGKIEETTPDIVILDVGMPSGSGLSVCEMMATHEELSSIPVIMLTGNSQEETIRRCHQLCAFYVLKCSDVWPRIEPILREILANDQTTENVTSDQSTSDELSDPSNTNRASEQPSVDEASDQPTNTNVASDVSQTLEEKPETTASGAMTQLVDSLFSVLGVEEGSCLVNEPNEVHQLSDQPWVLLIEDDDDFALSLQLRLREFGVKFLRASAGAEGYRRGFIESPQAIILDYELPQGNGAYVLRRLKETPATRDIPVIVLTGHHEKEIERHMRNLGACEFLTKPLDWKRLWSALSVSLEKNQLAGQVAR